MSYVSGSGVIGERSIWRLSLIPDLFWGAVNVVTLFFQTLLEPNLTSRGSGYSSSYSSTSRGGPPPPPRRRMGGFGPGGGGAAPMAGGG